MCCVSSLLLVSLQLLWYNLVSLSCAVSACSVFAGANITLVSRSLLVSVGLLTSWLVLLYFIRSFYFTCKRTPSILLSPVCLVSVQSGKEYTATNTYFKWKPLKGTQYCKQTSSSSRFSQLEYVVTPPVHTPSLYLCIPLKYYCR